MPCVEERKYESHLASPVEWHTTAELDVKSLLLQLVCLDGPLESLFSLDNLQFWGTDFMFEFHMRNSSRMLLFTG